MDSSSLANRSRGRHRQSKSSSAVGLLGSPLPKSQQASYVAHNAHQPQRQIARSYSAHYQHQPLTNNGVVTPPRSSKIHQPSGNGSPASGKKNKKTKPKNRPKDLTVEGGPFEDLFTGPPSPLRDLNTPTKAYAGPNFHSSPAPSSLPVPSFFSKSAPSTSDAISSLQALMLQDEFSSGLSSGSSSPEASESESPLEKLFRADKEEKARKNRPDVETPPTSPEPASGDFIGKKTVKIPPQLGDSSNRDLESSVFTMDLDKKESVSTALQPTDALAMNPNHRNSHDWKSKSEALMCFLDKIKPTVLDVSLPVGHIQSETPFPERRSHHHSLSNAANSHGQISQPSSPHQSISTSSPHLLRQHQSIYTSPRGPGKSRYQYPFVDQTPSLPRRYCNPLFTSPDAELVHKEKEVKPPNVKEMEDYLRKVLKLDTNSFSALAATS